MIALLVAAGAAVGAPTRYAAEVLVVRRTTAFPYATVGVNVVGSLLLGVVTGLTLHHGLGAGPRALVGTGLCGALTTFSAFSQQTAELLQRGRGRAAAINLLGSVALGLGAAAVGLWATS